MILRLPLVLALGLCAHANAQGLYDVSKIRTIEITAPTNWRTTMASNFSTKKLIKVDVKIDGKTYKDVGARHRGFSSYYFLPRNRQDKRPWKLLFDEFIDGQKVQGYRTLNLSNNIWDPTMVREVAGYEFMRRFMPAPKCCYVKVKVNGADLGVFTNTQQINKDFLLEHYRDDEGNRYRGDRASSRTPWNDSALSWLGNTLSRYQAAYELKTENGAYKPWVHLIAACNALNNTQTSQIPATVPKFFGIDSALRFIAVSNMTAWLDSYLGRTCKNFYIYDDPIHGQLTLLPWDVNNGLGGLPFSFGTSGIAKLPPFFREKDRTYPRPLFEKLVQFPKWRAQYLAHLRTMEKEFSWNKLGARITALRKQVEPHLKADKLAIYTMQQFSDSMTKALNLGFVTVPGLQTFIQDRNKYHSTEAEMIKKAPTLSALTRSHDAPTAKDTVTVTVQISGVAATEATLYYRSQGPFLEVAMFDDGKHGDGKAGDGVWGATIPAQPTFSQVDYYVSANSDLSKGGAMAILPATGSYRGPSYRVGGGPQGPIVISEFIAKNTNGMKDENGDTDDWIELTNISNQAASVSGLHLTDDQGTPMKWKIPAGQSIPAGGSLLIWADNETTQGTLHANFKLSSSGEAVGLYAADGKTRLDWVEFGEQLPDVSTGRLPGHLAFEVTFPQPTPTKPNQALPCGYVLYGSADPTAAAFELSASGSPKLLANVDCLIAKAPKSAPGALFIGGAASFQVPGLGALLLDPQVLFLLATFPTDTAGAAKITLKIPNVPAIKGMTFHLQSVVDNNGPVLSNGLAATICP